MRSIIRTINTVDTNTGSKKLFAIAILHRLCLDHVTHRCNDVTSVHNNDNDIAQLDIRPQTKDKTAINQDINNPAQERDFFSENTS